MIRTLLLLVFLPAAAVAQDRRSSHCIAVAQAPGLEYVHHAAYGETLPDYAVRLSYVDHAMFMLETPGGVRAVTDYTGSIGTARLPDVATMNRAHISHWTPTPDPAIPHVLPGWSSTAGEAVDHYVETGDLVVRSVSTDIRSGAGAAAGAGAATGVERNGNAIFVFEVAGLCIGHLGHLHQEPSDEQYAALGRLDVVMAPVDGGLTLDLPTMIRVVKTLRSSVVIPMHWFGAGSLDRFLNGMSDAFVIDRRSAASLEISLNTLPDRPTIVVLQPELLRDPR